MPHNPDQSLSQLQRQGKMTKKQLETRLIKRYGRAAGLKELKRLLKP